MSRCGHAQFPPKPPRYFADGLEPELREILHELGQADAQVINVQALEARLKNCKIDVAAKLAERIAADATLAPRMLQCFRDAISELRGLA